MKRILLVAAFLGVFCKTHGETYTATINGYTWTYYAHSATGSGPNWVRAELTLESVYPEPVGRMEMPSSIGGYDVVCIALDAFNGLWQVDEIVFPQKLRIIDSDAFKGCTGLKELILPNTIEDIGSGAFNYCTSLTNVVLSSGMSSAGWCFCNCTSLENVTIPNSIKYVDGFNNCTSLKSVEIPDSVCKIGDYAFGDCTSLRYLSIGHAVTSIGYRAFHDCTMLWDIVNYSPLTLTKGEDGVARYARNIYSDIPDGWGEILPLYSVAFDANGGTGNMEVFQLEIGRDQELPVNTFTRQNYSFNGWATTPDGNVEFEDGGTIRNLSIEEGATVCLYAVWKGDSYNIYFSGNGGDGCMEPQMVEYGTSTTLASNEFCRTGYKFAGWSTSRYNNYVDYADGCEFYLLYPQPIDIALYAVWYPNTYMVKFDLQGGSGSLSDSVFTYGEGNRAPYYSGSKMGYELLGWALAPEGELVFDAYGYAINNIMSDLLVEDGGEVTLYAVWRGVECSILFSGNGGSGSMSSILPYPRYDEEIALPINIFAREGYSFLGWSASWPTKSVDFTDGQTVAVSNVVSAYYGRYGGNYLPSRPTVWLEAVWENEIEMPIISPADGTYKNASCEVVLSCEKEGVVIYYTTNGGNPKTDGKIYTSPFTVWQSTIVKAVARREDGFWSDIAIRNVKREENLSEAANLFGYTMETDGDAAWIVDDEVSRDGGSSVKSGAIGNNETTYLQTSVKKAGRVSFWWRAMCEENDSEEPEEYYDYGAFLVDGVVVARIAGHDGEWRKVGYDITTGGKHTLRWEYRKDGATSYAPDCIWVDCVQWEPADDSGVTLTTPVEIPYTWLKKYELGEATDFETAGNSLSGKTQGGKATSVWQEYVMGTDPTNEVSQFKAEIKFEDGVPKVEWDPDLNAGGEELRVYKVFGKENLFDEDWTYPTNSLHRFFKVTVEMP